MGRTYTPLLNSICYVGEVKPGDSGVYQILHKESGKRYIGKASNILGRWESHYSDLSNCKYRHRYLQNAVNKHGILSFEFSVVQLLNLADLTSKEADEKLFQCEQHWIDYHRAAERQYGYNSAPASRSNLGFKHSEESLLKMRGSNNSKAKIEEETVKQIRQMAKNGSTYQAISDLLGLSRSGVRSAINGKNWLHVEEPPVFTGSLKGSKNNSAVLDEAKVCEIKKRIQKGERQSDIAKLFGVSKYAIFAINSGKTWAHVYVDPDIEAKAIQKTVLFARGKSTNGKLNAMEILQIIDLLKNGSKHKEIASQFNISTCYVSDINTGRRWRHLSVDFPIYHRNRK